MRSPALLFAAIVLLIALATALGQPTDSADSGLVIPAGLYVNVTYDGADGSCAGDCTLREAIIAANDGQAADIYVPAGTYTLSLACGVGDSETCGDLDVNADVHIHGSTSGPTNVDANGIDRVFQVGDEGTTFSNLTIRNGFHANVAAGGVYVTPTGELTIENSTIHGNSAPQGGGIWNDGWLVVFNTTIHNNDAHGSVEDGAAVYANEGSTTDITHTTVTGSTGTNAIFVEPNVEDFFLRYSILRNNIPNCAGGGFTPAGKNIFDDDTCSSVAADLVSTDPDLGSFKNNGGTTLTRRPNAGSPAIDALNQCPFEEDQRGVSRPQHSTCDIGSVEVAYCSGSTETKVGDAGVDVISGTAGVDVILGLAGNDEISGLGAGDRLCGNDGDDTIEGNGGADKMVGGAGTDTCNGNAGADTAQSCEAGVP
jgi:CSLREA domain-containing protein